MIRAAARLPHRECCMTGEGVCPYAGSTSIVLLGGSSLRMRKLRTWPARTGSAFDTLAGGPLFQRSLSIELRDARSAAGEGVADFSSFFAALAVGTRQMACTP